MRVLVISPEAGVWPVTTSLADTVNGSVRAYIGKGAEVRVYSPFFECDQRENDPCVDIFAGQERVRGEAFQVVRAENSPFFHIKHSGYFNRSGHYSDPDQIPYWDNHYRFSLLVSGALLHAAETGFVPDLIHCHEWGGALAGAYARKAYADVFGKSRVVLTIHNLEYDFHFLEQDIERVGLDRLDFNMDGFEFWGKVSLLKAGILYADKVAFASEGYRRQVLDRDLAGGIRGFLERNEGKLIGVQHGIDYSQWCSIPEAKKALKTQLQKEVGLEVGDHFLVYCHLDKETMRTAETLFTILTDLFHLPLQLLVGIPDTFSEQEYFHALAHQNPGRMAVVHFGSGILVQQKALAASDLLFLSNTEEPSASLVFKAMANGTLMVAGEDIGCAELLCSFVGDNLECANAFLVQDPWPDQMLRSLRLGLDFYTNERKNWDRLVTNAYAFRYPWENSVSSYLALKN